MNKHLIKISMMVSCLFCLSACATVVRGRQQAIPVSSNPSGAQIKVNGAPKGVTPSVVYILRGEENPLISLEKDGFKKYEIALDRKFYPYGLMNLCLGPLALGGSIADLVNHAGWSFTPDKINVELEKSKR